MKTWILLLVLGVGTTTIAQTVNADSLMKAAMTKLKSVPKYECDILVNLDVKFINIDERKGKVYFLPPDSIRYKIKGFAFLPKKGYNSHAFSVAEEDHIAIHLGKEKIDDRSCHIIKVIPNDIESEVVLGQFWVDKTDKIRKMVIVTRDEGNYNLRLKYGNEKYPVPSKVTITFDVKEQKLPGNMTGDLEAEEEELTEKELKERKKGRIMITYSNYVFN